MPLISSFGPKRDKLAPEEVSSDKQRDQASQYVKNSVDHFQIFYRKERIDVWRVKNNYKAVIKKEIPPLCLRIYTDSKQFDVRYQ